MARMSSYVYLAVRTLALVVIAASLWPFVADAYDGLVVRVAGSLSPSEMAVRAADGRIYLEFLGGASEKGLSIHGFMLHFGLILVMALVASTPSLGLARMVAWMAGVAGLFLTVHIAGLSLFIRGMSAAFQGEESVAAVGRVMTAFAIFWGLVPAVVGGAWCYWHWLPALRGSVRKNPNSLGKLVEDRQG